MAFFIDVIVPSKVEIEAQCARLKEIFHPFFVSVDAAHANGRSVRDSAAEAIVGDSADNSIVSDAADGDTADGDPSPSEPTPSIKAISTRDLHNGRCKNKFLLMTTLPVSDIDPLLDTISRCLAWPDA